eukprot:11226750-Lingulodinium_polyedra.AAC.1
MLREISRRAQRHAQIGHRRRQEFWPRQNAVAEKLEVFAVGRARAKGPETFARRRQARAACPE